MAAIIFISQPLLQGYFCRQATTVVGAGMGGSQGRMLWCLWSEYLKKKKQATEGESLFCLTCSPSSAKHTHIRRGSNTTFVKSLGIRRQSGDKHLDLGLQRILGLLGLPDASVPWVAWSEYTDICQRAVLSYLESIQSQAWAGTSVDLGSGDISAHRSHAADGALLVQLRSLGFRMPGEQQHSPFCICTQTFLSFSQSALKKNTRSCPCSFQTQKEFLYPILEFNLEFSFIAKSRSGFLHPGFGLLLQWACGITLYHPHDIVSCLYYRVQGSFHFLALMIFLLTLSKFLQRPVSSKFKTIPWQLF